MIDGVIEACNCQHILGYSQKFITVADAFCQMSQFLPRDAMHMARYPCHRHLSLSLSLSVFQRPRPTRFFLVLW